MSGTLTRHAWAVPPRVQDIVTVPAPASSELAIVHHPGFRLTRCVWPAPTVMVWLLTVRASTMSQSALESNGMAKLDPQRRRRRRGEDKLPSARHVADEAPVAPVAQPGKILHQVAGEAILIVDLRDERRIRLDFSRSHERPYGRDDVADLRAHSLIAGENGLVVHLPVQRIHVAVGLDIDIGAARR